MPSRIALINYSGQSRLPFNVQRSTFGGAGAQSAKERETEEQVSSGQSATPER